MGRETRLVLTWERVEVQPPHPVFTLLWLRWAPPPLRLSLVSGRGARQEKGLKGRRLPGACEPFRPAGAP